MSSRHDSSASTRRGSRLVVRTPRRDDRLVSGLPRPTGRELVTVCSVPAVLLVVHFLVQPALDLWVRLGYVRYSVAASAPAHRIAPEPFTAYSWAWHELTRLAHALIHAPSAYHTHVFTNVTLIVATAWALLVVLTALGHRRWFPFVYWELVVVSPVVGSFAFDLYGQTALGYGASTIAFAFLGVVSVVSALALVRARLDSSADRLEAGQPVSSDGGHVVSPFVMGAFFCLAVVAVVGDLVVASPAMAVHQAGVGFGVLVGAVVVTLTR